MHFVKMHGCGNDYIYVDCFEQTVEDPEKLAVVMSDRHFGIGGDGLVLICPSDTADVRMRMFNLDGSEGNMCGNAIRCVGKYMYDSGRARKDIIAVDTKSGLRTLEMTVENGTASGARVNMGKAV
ncbi:MAG: diaminopimelate epimerase, partial [Oscillospiraceae bacterium]|nr:diaminopimelate epimerase [Oscillospiraceae bacterium]